jgi:ABC-type spermidine/putrescine transport system permease subunit I
MAGAVVATNAGVTAAPGGGSAARAARLRRRTWLRAALLVGPALAVVVILIVVPAVLSFGGTAFVDGRPSLDNYRDFFGNAQSVNNLRFTIAVTLASVGILLLAGLAIALYLRFSQSRLVAAIQVLALFPLFVPGIVASFALIRFLGPAGWVAVLLQAIGIDGYQTPYLHASGAVIGLVWQELPMTVLMLMAGLAQVSNRAIEAARDVGAGSARVFVHIILPQIGRPVAVAACLGCLDIVGSFTVPYILGPAAPQMMSLYMQRSFSELHRPAAAETQAAITFAVCLVIGAIYTAFVFRESGEQVRAVK